MNMMTVILVEHPPPSFHHPFLDTHERQITLNLTLIGSLASTNVGLLLKRGGPDVSVKFTQVVFRMCSLAPKRAINQKAFSPLIERFLACVHDISEKKRLPTQTAPHIRY